VADDCQANLGSRNDSHDDGEDCEVARVDARDLLGGGRGGRVQTRDGRWLGWEGGWVGGCGSTVPSILS